MGSTFRVQAAGFALLPLAPGRGRIVPVPGANLCPALVWSPAYAAPATAADCALQVPLSALCNFLGPRLATAKDAACTQCKPGRMRDSAPGCR